MDNWEKVFFNNIPAYLLIINASLSIQFESTPLKKYVKLLGGYAFKSSEYQKTGIPIIRISDFQNEKIVLKKAICYNESEEFERYELNSGDIIIALTGGTIGKLAIVQSGLGKLYLNQRVAKFQVLDTSKIANEYVYWVARGVQDNVKKLAWGGAQPNVSSKQVEEMNFPIPDIETQFNIIEFINDLKNGKLKTKIYFSQSVEAKILKLQETTLKIFDFSSEQEKQSDIISKLKQAILQEAIAGHLTAEWRTQSPMQKGNPDTDAAALLAKIKAEKQQAIADGKLKKENPLAEIAIDEIPFSIPDNWVWCRLEEVVKIAEAGKSFLCKDGETRNRDWGIIKTSAITSGIFVESENKLYSESVPEEIKYKIEIGDLIFCRASGSKGLAGLCCLVESLSLNLLLSDKTIRVKLSDLVLPEILNLYNKSDSSRKYRISLSTQKSTSMNNITRGELLGEPFPLPPLAEQKAIMEKVDKLMNIIDQLEQQIKHRKQLAENLMQTVLREAFE
ncbi:type I restriction-modification system, specificity subunit S [Pseudanabaena sp. lw0831]|uniref:restriction endonuclease subunit S n=1 Tax=Pseudanabaena sp. lw0831 TaxID=1357935 RepID=UPI0019160102|nr:restriction endonuclease subunit S [Pseudanabaena sp. lw0831]GBO51838.1 type I restriction-modification system, specificity subunit S [Pseudanabaena sp. lw0831]